jgi:hypothetical protein
MTEWIPGAEKSPDRVDALCYALSILNLNAYAGRDFDLPHFDAIEEYDPFSKNDIGYSLASNGFEDIWGDEDY